VSGFPACWPVLIAAGLALPSARADAVKIEGYADLRLIHAPDERAWEDGGLGKTRFGGGDDDVKLVEVVGEITAEIAPELTAFAGLRYDEHQRTPVDLMEAYLAWSPESDGPWRWSLKAGAFYAPISQENDQIGWASSWTITPSAINTWVGEELKTIGLEGAVEWRGEADRFSVFGALYGWNDPAGVLIADRGWALSDRPTGLFDEPRLPDAFAVQMGWPPPITTPMFREIDDRVGWYAGASWARPGWGRITVMRYDNNGDPAAEDEGTFAWRTEFWSAGLQTSLAGFVIHMQGMSGETEIAPSPFYAGITEFRSAYLLVGKVIGRWRLGARIEAFETTLLADYGNGTLVEDEYGSETGEAATLAAFWTHEDWLQLGGEVLFISSQREQREVMGLDAESDETQLQLSTKVFY
jgi:hypothetical protein